LPLVHPHRRIHTFTRTLSLSLSNYLTFPLWIKRIIVLSFLQHFSFWFSLSCIPLPKEHHVNLLPPPTLFFLLLHRFTLTSTYLLIFPTIKQGIAVIFIIDGSHWRLTPWKTSTGSNWIRVTTYLFGAQ
jgi:hypothetical protein